MDLITWIVLGVAIIVLGAIAVILVERRNSTNGDRQDDPLQARLAEYIQRGEAVTLEGIELSQPFVDRVFVPILKKLGVKIPREEKDKYDTLEKVMSESKKTFNISVSYPKLVSKRFETTFLFQVFLAKEYARAKENIEKEFQDQETSEHISSTELKIGEKVKVKLFHPDFDFSDGATKMLDKPLNKIVFIGKPKDHCEPGLRKILVTILNAKTEQELESFTFTVNVVDFAFGHVSRPLLSRVSTIILGVGSFAMFVLAFLEQIDKTVGLTSGTAAGILAVGVYANFYNLYQRVRPNTP
jgi:hypothetical protein